MWVLLSTDDRTVVKGAASENAWRIVRLIKDLLLTRDQQVVALDDGKPCPHCRGKQALPITAHLVLWTVPNALVFYDGEDERAVCLDCLDERREHAKI